MTDRQTDTHTHTHTQSPSRCPATTITALAVFERPLTRWACALNTLRWSEPYFVQHAHWQDIRSLISNTHMSLLSFPLALQLSRHTPPDAGCPDQRQCSTHTIPYHLSVQPLQISNWRPPILCLSSIGLSFVVNNIFNLQVVHPRCVWLQYQISKDVGWVSQNTTLYYGVKCHRVDDMFRPFTIRPSSGLTWWKLRQTRSRLTPFS